VTEKTLDPSDWNQMRELGHQMVDDMMTYLSGLSDRPAWRQVPEASVRQIKGELPSEQISYEMGVQ